MLTFLLITLQQTLMSLLKLLGLGNCALCNDFSVIYSEDSRLLKVTIPEGMSQF